MAHYVVDLRARIVPSHRRIWRLFPGENYRFLAAFLADDQVFLDLPGLKLPRGSVDENDPTLVGRLLHARDMREWADKAARARRHGEEIPPGPSDDLASYMDGKLPRNAQAEKAAVVGLFGRAQKGDIVLVPDRIASRTVWAAEFLTDPAQRESGYLPGIYGDIAIPARPVRWFPKIDELAIPDELSDGLRRPNPFVSVERSLYPDILSQTYGTYVSSNLMVGRFETKSSKFTPRDNFDLVFMSQAVECLTDMIEGRTTKAEGKKLLDYAAVLESSESAQALSINVNSPGYFLFSSTRVIPIVLTALLALSVAASGELLSGGVQLPQVTIVNTLALGEDDPCAPKVQQHVRETLNLMGLEAWEELCRRAARLHEGPQLEGSGRGRIDPTQHPGSSR